MTTLRTRVRPMRYRWASALLVVAVALLTTGCPWSGSAKTTATTTIKELAGALAGSSEDAARMETKLLAANRGNTQINSNVARELEARPGVIAKIWDATDDARDLACEAWTSGASTVDLTTVGGLEAQSLLNQMRTDTDQGKAVVESVTFACELAGIDF